MSRWLEFEGPAVECAFRGWQWSGSHSCLNDLPLGCRSDSARLHVRSQPLTELPVGSLTELGRWKDVVLENQIDDSFSPGRSRERTRRSVRLQRHGTHTAGHRSLCRCEILCLSVDEECLCASMACQSRSVANSGYVVFWWSGWIDWTDGVVSIGCDQETNASA